MHIKLFHAPLQGHVKMNFLFTFNIFICVIDSIINDKSAWKDD